VAKVTSKLQVTIPKAIADRYGIRPGDEIEWVAAGDGIRVVPPGKPRRRLDLAARLALFDAATERLARLGRGRDRTARTRGWARDDLYRRGRRPR
jgi:AbrB family looped-hinge helix DNA binding protein